MSSQVANVVSRLCAGAVGAVFAVAAASKFLEWRGWRTDATALGVPAVIAACVPPTEIALGVALIAAPVNVVVLGIATAVLLVFTTFVAVSVMAGRQAPCACFGARSRRTMSWRDVARNVSLIALLVIAASTAQT